MHETQKASACWINGSISLQNERMPTLRDVFDDREQLCFVERLRKVVVHSGTRQRSPSPIMACAVIATMAIRHLHSMRMRSKLSLRVHRSASRPSAA
jgi:hypothetical protein